MLGLDCSHSSIYEGLGHSKKVKYKPCLISYDLLTRKCSPDGPSLRGSYFVIVKAPGLGCQKACDGCLGLPCQVFWASA